MLCDWTCIRVRAKFSFLPRWLGPLKLTLRLTLGRDGRPPLLFSENSFVKGSEGYARSILAVQKAACANEALGVVGSDKEHVADAGVLRAMNNAAPFSPESFVPFAVEKAEVLERLAKGANLGESKRFYVPGTAKCVGAMTNKQGKAAVYTIDRPVLSLVKQLNEVLREWAHVHAPQGSAGPLFS